MADSASDSTDPSKPKPAKVAGLTVAVDSHQCDSLLEDIVSLGERHNRHLAYIILVAMTCQPCGRMTHWHRLSSIVRVCATLVVLPLALHALAREQATLSQN